MNALPYIQYSVAEGHPSTNSVTHHPRYTANGYTRRPPNGYTATFKPTATFEPKRWVSVGPISPPAKGAWDTGVYRNLFSESGMHTPSEVDRKVQQIYDQIFGGDETNERL